MRAVRHDREAAIAMGIPAQRIFMVTFAIGTAMAAFGGVVAAPITTVAFRSGVDLLPFCFMAVITGGLGPLPAPAAPAVLREGPRQRRHAGFGTCTSRVLPYNYNKKNTDK